jgi:hypothetical protein
VFRRPGDLPGLATLRWLGVKALLATFRAVECPRPVAKARLKSPRQRRGQCPDVHITRDDGQSVADRLGPQSGGQWKRSPLHDHNRQRLTGTTSADRPLHDLVDCFRMRSIPAGAYNCGLEASVKATRQDKGRFSSSL